MLIIKPGMMIFFTAVTFLSCFVFSSGEKLDLVNVWVMINIIECFHECVSAVIF